jgi:hypothetical protein
VTITWIIVICALGLLLTLGWHDSGHPVDERTNDDQDNDQPPFWWG